MSTRAILLPHHSVNSSSYCSISPEAKLVSTKFIPSANVQEVNPSWHERIVIRLDNIEKRLDCLIPNRPVQNSFDKMCREIKEEFASKDFDEFNRWIDSNGDGAWYCRLATFLAKLPLRVARNMLGLIGSLIKTLIKWSAYAMMHPMKAPIELAKKLVDLIHALTQPATWSRIGAGTLGASLGQAFAVGNPLSAITMAIAIAMIIGGVTIETLKAALEAHPDSRKEKIVNHLLNEGHSLPEMMLTGLTTGLLIGGIQKLVQEFRYSDAIRKKLSGMAKEQAAEYVRENGYPEGYMLKYSEKKITISWDIEQFPELRYDPNFEIESIPQYKTICMPDHSCMTYVKKITIVARKSIDLKGYIAPPLPPMPGQDTWNQRVPVLATAYALRSESH